MSPAVSRAPTAVAGPLPLPVIIPPQRPGSISRGFIAAYAPCLESCSIDQLTFLRFIEDVNNSFKGNQVFAGIQVACFGAGVAPSAIAKAVVTVVAAGSQVANDYHVRHKYGRVKLLSRAVAMSSWMLTLMCTEQM